MLILLTVREVGGCVADYRVKALYHMHVKENSKLLRHPKFSQVFWETATTETTADAALQRDGLVLPDRHSVSTSCMSPKIQSLNFLLTGSFLFVHEFISCAVQLPCPLILVRIFGLPYASV